jgi:hypothetical protein
MAGLGMCKSVSVKRAVQKTAVGGAKNGGSGLEKKPTPMGVCFYNSYHSVDFQSA